MNVELAEERILVLADRFSMEQAEGRAWAKRIDAFGALAKVTGFLKQPRDDEFEVTYRERRLQPFWRLVVRTQQLYERRRSYSITVAPEVKEVSICGETQTIQGGHAVIEGLETCQEDRSREVFHDGLTREIRPALAEYLRYASDPVDGERLAALTAEGVVVVPSEAKASALVRDLIGASLGKIEADRVIEEKVRVEAIDLYYRPVYAFRYRWQGKEAVVEVDAVSGEAKVGGSTFEQYLGKAMDPRFLLDVSAEAANMFIPGANLAKMALIKGLELAKREG